MIGKQEWEEMIRQIQELENKMECHYKNLAENINDDKIKNTLMKLVKDESMHSKHIEWIVKLIKK